MGVNQRRQLHPLHLFEQQRNVVDALRDDVGYLIHAQSLAQSGIYLQIWANRQYRGDQIDIPTKKPRKSQKNPTPELSAAQKAVNKALSQVRIFVEHAIGGMKRYNILVNSFRNRKDDFEDDAIGICAGLWNLVFSY